MRKMIAVLALLCLCLAGCTESGEVKETEKIEETEKVTEVKEVIKADVAAYMGAIGTYYHDPIERGQELRTGVASLTVQFILANPDCVEFTDGENEISVSADEIDKVSVNLFGEFAKFSSLHLPFGVEKDGENYRISKHYYDSSTIKYQLKTHSVTHETDEEVHIRATYDYNSVSLAYAGSVSYTYVFEKTEEGGFEFLKLVSVEI